MLRLIVLFLLLANGVYFAWSQGLLAAYGWAPAPVSEPHRLEQQIKPDTLRVLPRRSPAASSSSEADEVKPAVAALTTERAVECLIAGIFDDAQAGVLRQALGARLPAAAWGLEPVVITPGRWIVYMGRYPNAEWVERKRAELRALRVRFEPPANPALEPGLALGRFDTEEDAARELTALTRRGVHTARVAIERPEVRGSQLRLPAVDDTVRASLEEVKVALAGKQLKPCAA